MTLLFISPNKRDVFRLNGNVEAGHKTKQSFTVGPYINRNHLLKPHIALTLVSWRSSIFTSLYKTLLSHVNSSSDQFR